MPAQNHSEPSFNTPSFIEHLEQVSDPRMQNANLEHSLVDVLAIAFCCVLCGGDGITTID